VLSAVVL
jgi:hypothetical protein